MVSPRRTCSTSTASNADGAKGKDQSHCTLPILWRSRGPEEGGRQHPAFLLQWLPMVLAPCGAAAEVGEVHKGRSLSNVLRCRTQGGWPSEIRKKRRREGAVMDSGGGGPVRCPHPPTPRTRLGL